MCVTTDAGNSDTPRSRSPRWRRATVIVNTGEESAAIEADVDAADGAASTPPERPPRPHRMMSSPQIMATPTRSPEAISPSIGLKERFSRLFSREATSGEDSTDGSRSASPKRKGIAYIILCGDTCPQFLYYFTMKFGV